MRNTRAFSLALCVVCAALTPSAWGAVEPLPTADEIHQLFTDGKYPEVLHKLARAMGSKEWKGEQFDHYDLLMVKAETHLRLKEAGPASAAFAQAAKEAPDRKSIAIARANEFLIKKTISLHYTRKPAPGADKKGADKNAPPPMEIVEPEQRKLAFEALYEDEKATLEPKFKAAREGKSVPAIVDLYQPIAQLKMLDFAVNGSDEQTKQTVELLAEHAKDVLGEAVEKLGTKVDVIASSANSLSEVRVQGQNKWIKKGLQNMQPGELAEARNTCTKIIEVTKSMEEGLQTEPGYFAEVAKNAKRIADKADKALDEDYGGYYDRQSGKRA
ncbi:MAG TPA: hypothetical protein VG269_01065 [Tepidisphaeraceae bacterium]|jgi:hypothetical protein|nr:hypothetical protein [Tepidisphaeraceae bacterium]